MSLLLDHGVPSALEYVENGELAKAHAASNPEIAPHFSFVDVGGHGCAIVWVDGGRVRVHSAAD